MTWKLKWRRPLGPQEEAEEEGGKINPGDNKAGEVQDTGRGAEEAVEGATVVEVSGQEQGSDMGGERVQW